LVRGGSRTGTTGLGCRRAPEALDSRSAALVRDGDLIRVDIAARRADPLVARCELEARRDSRAPILPRSSRGFPNSPGTARIVGAVVG
jgi:dihydroxy-acid dehydratase